ncbi:acyl-CoA N-acyltransferase [Gongronella butleri]|nr:acyl-CoA N-acyltransferase [Gongronella butleri]
MPSNPLDLYDVREATENDLPDILEIYNERVLNSTCLFVYDPLPLSDRQAWFEDTKKKGYPVIVAVEKATGKTVSYGSLGGFRSKPCYDLSAEISVYIHVDHHRRGLGQLLLVELIRISEQMKLRSIIASITADNAASMKLFEKHGFKFAGCFHDCGYKFGHFLDVNFLELILDVDVKFDGPVSFDSFPWGKYTYPISA